jgi:hypothetical protein
VSSPPRSPRSSSTSWTPRGAGVRSEHLLALQPGAGGPELPHPEDIVQAVKRVLNK